MKNNEVQVVIGGSGFIGMNLKSKLELLGTTVIIVDKDDGESGNLINASTQWPVILYDKLNKEPTIRIWHLAANSDIQKSSLNPVLDYLDTLGSTLQVIQFAKLLGTRCKGIEFTSSSAVYGQGISSSFKESDPLNPISYYGVMKLASEKVLQLFSRESHVPIHIYRLPNIVGPFLTHGVIYDLINRLFQNPNRLKVLGNGEQRKVYIHVEDLVSFFLEVSSINHSLTLNVSNGDNGLSVKQIVESIISKMNLDPAVEYERFEAGWPGDVTQCVLDPSIMKKYSNLVFRSSEKSIQQAIENRLSELSWPNV